MNSLFQKFTKSDPGNQARIGRHVNRTAKTVEYVIPAVFSLLRDVIIGLDKALCRRSAKSVGIMTVFRK